MLFYIIIITSKPFKLFNQLCFIRCDTAKSVLALSAADIAKRADLEDETVEEVMDILRAEFEEDEE